MQRKRPLHGKIFARCIPKQLFAGLFGYMARISCQNQLISDAWRANLAANWRFSRPRPLLGCMERKTCHGLPPGNAPWRNIATTSRPKTHSRRSCHGRAPGFAPHQITAALPAKKRRRRQDLENVPARSTKDRVLARLGRAAGYGAVQRHRRTLGNAPRRNIAMADNAPRDKRRRAFCSPSFAVLFTARVAIGAFAVGSRRHLAVSLIEAHIR